MTALFFCCLGQNIFFTPTLENKLNPSNSVTNALTHKNESLAL